VDGAGRCYGRQANIVEVVAAVKAAATAKYSARTWLQGYELLCRQRRYAGGRRGRKESGFQADGKKRPRGRVAVVDATGGRHVALEGRRQQGTQGCEKQSQRQREERGGPDRKRRRGGHGRWREA